MRSNLLGTISRHLTNSRNMNDVTKVDFLVLGAGSGGIASARRAAEFGLKPLIIEQGPLGGTCVGFFLNFYKNFGFVKN